MQEVSDATMSEYFCSACAAHFRETVTVDPDKENLTVHSYDRDLREAVDDYVVDVFVYDQFRETARNLEVSP